ncbi:MAG: hypothetical protein AB8G23_20990 [Myxococcota bacterium]
MGSQMPYGARVVFGLLLLTQALLFGCAKPAEIEGQAEVFLPRHPFPQWVGNLKAGESDAKSVMARFGSPDEIENRARGGQIWRYRLEEIQWPENDPRRPNISMDGEFKSRASSSIASAKKWSEGAAGWFDRTFFFPPKQPRPAAIRMLPATVHRLELVFEADDLLSDYRYAPGMGRAEVPEEG